MEQPRLTKLNTIEEFVLAGLETKLRRVFGCDVVVANTIDRMKILSKVQEGKSVKYPYILGSVQSIGHNQTGYASNMMARRGIVFDVNPAGNAAQAVRILPANFEIEIQYVTNKFTGNDASVLFFMRRWLFARRAGYMKFDVDYGRLTLKISVELSETVSAPTKENVTEQESNYTTTASLTLNGYISEPVAGDTGIIQEVEFNTLVGPNATVWSFN